ncbi:MAG: hypothetical protein R2746_01775 [Acidimicrobiales bacterium]|nr:hypothetical protein [Actinomycetota bacterium]
MRFTRWWNPSLPQTLLYSVMLLYFNAAFSLFALMGLGIGGSAYSLAPVLFDSAFDSAARFDAVQTVAVLGGTLAYGFGGLGIANGQKLGWKVGVAVASGAVLLPVIAIGRGFSLGGTNIIPFLFDLALLVLLVHPMSRSYQRIWFDGSSRPRR